MTNELQTRDVEKNGKENKEEVKASTEKNAKNVKPVNSVRRGDIKIKHLVFSGGGIKGLVYIGCLKGLEHLQLLKDVESCTGCSIGSIMAALIVLGYSSEELYDFILHFNYHDLRDISFLKAFHNYGLETGEKIYQFLGALIKKKVGNPNITFAELYQVRPITLTINATCLNTYQVCYFNHLTHPDMSVVMALRMSISIPFLIRPVVHQKQFYVDGGLLDNFPINQVPDSPETLGFNLESVPDLGISYHITGLESYVYHIFGCVYSEVNKIRLDSIEHAHIVDLDTQNVTSLSVNLTPEQRVQLFNIGYHAVCQHFDDVDADTETIITSPS